MRAEDDTGCLYRGPNQTRCAIGILIPNRLYRKEMEGTLHRLMMFPEIEELIGIKNEALLTKLQIIHDQKAPRCWEEELLALGIELGLKTEVINNE